jgi:hypothetical protein
VRTLLCSLIVAVGAMVARPAIAEDAPAPSKDQLDAAKKAFEEADTLYKAGKPREAIVKLEESYRLSRNVVLLYNIAHAYDQAGDKPKALAFYVKFLELAPATAPKRDESTKRVDELKAAKIEPELAATQGLLDEPVDLKPVSKYLADFRHSPVDTIAPGKPIDVSADAPRAANWVVTLFYRATTDDTYTGQPMTWRAGVENVLVGQIPGAKTTGTAVYYFLEVKDADGTLVTRSGRRTSPHLVKIESRAVSTGPVKDDPLLRVEKPTGPPRQLITPTSVATTAAVVLVGATITTYLIAKQKGDDLRFDSTGCGVPPCQVFDAEFDQPLEKSGRRYNRIYQVTLVASVAAIGVAGYFWYRSLTKKPGRDKVTVVPAVGDGFVGAFAGRPF